MTDLIPEHEMGWETQRLPLFSKQYYFQSSKLKVSKFFILRRADTGVIFNLEDLKTGLYYNSASRSLNFEKWIFKSSVYASVGAQVRTSTGL